MNKIWFCWVVLLLIVPALSGCDAMMPNDVADRQEHGRMNRAVPEATELPPGLGEDLPAPVASPETATPDSGPHGPISAKQ